MGINSELEIGGRVYHVQTEDRGMKHRSIVTHVFVDGRVTASRRSAYPHASGELPFERQIVAIMRAQHDESLRALQEGVLTEPEDEGDLATAAALSLLTRDAEALPHAPEDLPALPTRPRGLDARPERVLPPPPRARPRVAALELLGGADAGRIFPLDTAPMRLGRSPDCNIQLSDPTVAPLHAILIIDHSGEWRVTRVDAQASLRVDGAARQSASLGDHAAVLEVGRVRLRYLPPVREAAHARTAEASSWPETELARAVPTTDDLVLPPPASPEDMVLVAGGPVRLGGKGRAVAPFLLQRAPVTNRQFLDYLEESGAPLPAHWLGARPPVHLDAHPVVGVTQAEARAYAEWRGLRLPEAGEWALAARGAEGRRFPWGPRWDAARVACREGGAAGTVPVTALGHGASPEGIVHLLGNVWEWTAADDLALGLEPGRTLVLGGAFSTDCARGAELPMSSVDVGKAYDYLGFRCASDLEL